MLESVANLIKTDYTPSQNYMKYVDIDDTRINNRSNFTFIAAAGAPAQSNNDVGTLAKPNCIFPS